MFEDNPFVRIPPEAIVPLVVIGGIIFGSVLWCLFA